MEKVVAVVFAYNEEKSLPKTLSILTNFKRQGLIHEIVVINDGSMDNTLEIAKKFKVNVVSHVENKGKREAFITGANEVRRLGGQIMLSLDADIQIFPKNTLKKMISEIKSGKQMVMVRPYEKLQSHRRFNLINYVRSGLGNNFKIYNSFEGGKIMHVNKPFSIERYAGVESSGSLGQRAIDLSALSPLFNNNKKWLTYFRSNSHPFYSKFSDYYSESAIKLSEKWGLEKALDLLIPRSKVSFLDLPIFHRSAFHKEQASSAQNLSKIRLNNEKKFRDRQAVNLLKLRKKLHLARTTDEKRNIQKKIGKIKGGQRVRGKK